MWLGKAVVRLIRKKYKPSEPDRVDPEYQVLIHSPSPAHVPIISINDEEEQPEVQAVARPRVARSAVEGEKEKPIDVELLADVDVPVKMEEEE